MPAGKRIVNKIPYMNDAALVSRGHGSNKSLLSHVVPSMYMQLNVPKVIVETCMCDWNPSFELRVIGSL
jgi:hypothetical protein